MNIQEFVSREKLRGDGFRLLAACFYQPQKDIFQEGLLHDLAASLKELRPDAADYAEEMIRLLQAYSDEELLVDYSKLFVGPAELLAPPYGSVYLEIERRLMGDSTIAAIDFYKSRGLVMDADFKEVPDHIAVELEFMYYLVFKELEAIEVKNMEEAAAALESQKIFMNSFLRPWADKFTEKMTEGAETGFYKALAGCLSAFVYRSDIHDSLPEKLKAAAVS